MIVLDTNVVSELMRPRPDDAVVRWVDRFPEADVFLTSVTAAELRYGVARLPEGRRAQELAAKVEALLEEDFQDQILPFDTEASEYYALIAAARERAGAPISMADAQIAAMCRHYDTSLATRNTKDFTDTGVSTVDPWCA